MPEVSNDGVRISYDVVGRGSAACAAARLVLRSIVVDRAGVRRRTQERSPPRHRRPPRPRCERQAARSRRLHLGCPDRRRVRGRRRRRFGSVRDLGAVLRRMDRVDDRSRRPGAGPGDRDLGSVGPATRARRADGDRRVGRGPQAAAGRARWSTCSRSSDGETFDREFPPWAQAVTLRADPEALLAAHAPELWTDGIPDEDLRSFPVPALLIAGELEDEDDDAAKVAAMIPNGQSLRLPGLGHGGACAASALTVPTARAFLDRWFA